MENIERKSI